MICFCTAFFGPKPSRAVKSILIQKYNQWNQLNYCVYGIPLRNSPHLIKIFLVSSDILPEEEPEEKPTKCLKQNFVGNFSQDFCSSNCCVGDTAWHAWAPRNSEGQNNVHCSILPQNICPKSVFWTKTIPHLCLWSIATILFTHTEWSHTTSFCVCKVFVDTFAPKVIASKFNLTYITGKKLTSSIQMKHTFLKQQHFSPLHFLLFV